MDSKMLFLCSALAVIVPSIASETPYDICIKACSQLACTGMIPTEYCEALKKGCVSACSPMPGSGCTDNSKCEPDRACVENKCVDPCLNKKCTENSSCTAVNHICTCKEGFTGDADKGCTETNPAPPAVVTQ